MPSVLPPPRAPPKKISAYGQPTRRRCEPACDSQGPPAAAGLVRDLGIPFLPAHEMILQHRVEIRRRGGLAREEAEMIAERDERQALVAELELHLPHFAPVPALGLALP